MLLDLSWKQTGYVAAALAESGIETTLVTTDRPDHIGLGRYCRQIRSPHPRSPEYVPFLRQQIATVRPDLLIPLCEPLMQLLWDLDPPCDVPTYPPTTAGQREVLRDRRRLYERAARAGIAVAPWLPIGGPANLERAARELGYPFVLRGTAGFAGGQVRVVSSPREAAEALDDLRGKSPGEPFAQEFVRGPRHLVGGFFSRGETIRVFAQEALESHPPVTGPSIRVRPHRDAELIRSTKTLFADLQWSGLACVEFIRDERGRCVLMDVNPRPWGSLEVAERSGAGVCLAFAESLAGRAVAPPGRHRVRVSGIVLEGFLQSRSRGSGIGSTLRTLGLGEWIDCLRALPWTRPRLAIYILRRIYRGLDA